MKRTAKKSLVACLVLSLLLAMLPMISVSAAAPELDIITDVEFKTVEINGNMPDEAGEQLSLIIMDADYEGDFSGVFENVDSIVALDQIAVDANGKFSYNTVLASVKADAGYRLFINGVEKAEVVFASPIGVMAGDTVLLPIIVKNGTDFAGLTGSINYDPEFFTLDSITSAAGFVMQSIGDRFVVASENGLGYEGDVLVGYAILTVNSELEEGALSTISFDIDEALSSEFEAEDVRIASSKFAVLDSVLPGDVDLDGDVDLADAILLLQYLSENAELSSKALRAADVLADGLVNTADAVVIMQMCL